MHCIELPNLSLCNWALLCALRMCVLVIITSQWHNYRYISNLVNPIYRRSTSSDNPLKSFEYKWFGNMDNKHVCCDYWISLLSKAYSHTDNAMSLFPLAVHSKEVYTQHSSWLDNNEALYGISFKPGSYHGKDLFNFTCNTGKLLTLVRSTRNSWIMMSA